MRTAHDLFIHELSDMLTAEQIVLEALQEQEQNAARDDLKKLLQMHRGQTEKQVERLEQCFEEIDAEPEDTECEGMNGLAEEYRSFLQEDPSKDILDVFSVSAGAKVEHYEISGYETLIDLAKMMGHKKSERLLSQNLKEEQQMLKKLEQLKKKVKPELTGHEEEEEGAEEVSASRSGRSKSRSGRAA